MDLLDGIAKLEEIAHSVLHLASNASSFVTTTMSIAETPIDRSAADVKHGKLKE